MGFLARGGFYSFTLFTFTSSFSPLFRTISRVFSVQKLPPPLPSSFPPTLTLSSTASFLSNVPARARVLSHSLRLSYNRWTAFQAFAQQPLLPDVLALAYFPFFFSTLCVSFTFPHSSVHSFIHYTLIHQRLARLNWLGRQHKIELYSWMRSFNKNLLMLFCSWKVER